MKIISLKAILAVAAFSVSTFVNAGIMEYDLLSISERGDATTATYTGNGYIGAYSSSFSGIFCLEASSCKTALQADISGLQALGNITINSVSLSFDLKESSNGTQDITASAFNSGGVLSHHFNAPMSYAQETFNVTGQSSNSLDITNMFNQAHSAGDNWFALHLNATDQYMWTWTQAGYDRDDANVRITVDYSANSIPEPATLGIFALGVLGLATRRKVK